MIFSIFNKLKSSIISKMKSGMKKSNPDEILRDLFKTSVNAVQPHNLINDGVKLTESHLAVQGKNYELSKPVCVVGFGKAVLGMAIALETILGKHLQRGIVSIPHGTLEQFKIPENSKIKYLEGAENNLPDENSMNTALKIKQFVQNLDKNDTVIVLISGGGSALLPLPKKNITLSEKQDLVKKLGNCGADITEMNCVRKELSELKGGGLAKICYPARVITLILSDVIGDPLDIIASGPTCVNEDTTDKAIAILNKYNLYENLPENIKTVLNGNLCEKGAHVSQEDGTFIHVDNFILGSNEIAARAILEKAREINFQSAILSTRISGKVENISPIYANIAKSFEEFRNNMTSIDETIKTLLEFRSELFLKDEHNLMDELKKFDSTKDICLVLAGEPTVVVSGKGKGGRNQQLALSVSVDLYKSTKGTSSSDIWFSSCGTDGIDGPTDAAGAIGYSTLVPDSIRDNLEPERFLQNNDCYNFYTKFDNGKYLVQVGHTGTNVMDIHVILIMRNSEK